MRGRQRDVVRPLQVLDLADWPDIPIPTLDRSKVLVWEMRDFERVVKQIENCQEIMYLAEAYFEPLTESVRAKAHDRLYSQVDMEAARRKRLARPSRQAGLTALPASRDTTDYY